MTQRLDYQKLSAAGLRAFGGVYVYIVNSGLPKALIDLVFLRASQINGCAYCIDMHSRDLLKGGVSVEKVMLVSAWREAGDIFTARRRPPCTGPRRHLVSESHAPDEAFAAVSAEFQPKEVSDLTLAIGVINVTTASPSASAARKTVARGPHPTILQSLSISACAAAGLRTLAPEMK